jgi:hypothetical protein
MVKGLMIKEMRCCGLIQSIGGLFLKERDRSFGGHRISRDGEERNKKSGFSPALKSTSEVF